jgi:alkylation response protein AidB-like acyl-CoA dehydrogenase
MEEGPRLEREEQAILDRAIAFGRDEVAPDAASWERERRFPLDTLRSAAALGLAGIEVPKAHGGLGGSFVLKTRIAEELAKHSMGFAFSLINTQNVATRIALQGSEAQRRRLLPALLRAERIGGTSLTEPGAGSDFPAIATTARRTADGWVLNGEKAWLTNAAAADIVLVYAQTEPGSGAKGIACFLVEGGRAGFERLPPYGLMGGHAIGAGGIRLTDCLVAEEDLFQPPGEAFKRALAGINGART